MLEQLSDLQADTLMKTLRRSWFKLFEPPTMMICDQEGNFASDLLGADLERLGVYKRLVPKGRHVPVVEARQGFYA